MPEPHIVPVNYVLVGEAPVFRTGPGSKLDAAAESAPVASEVDAAEEATRPGWSVVVRGALAEVTGRRIRIPDDLRFT